MAKINVGEIVPGAAQLAADLIRPTRQVIKRHLLKEAARAQEGVKETRQTKRQRARDIVREVMREARGKDATT